MKNITMHKGKISNLKRLPSSRYGNPRYEMKIDGVDVIIKPQAYGHSVSLLGDYCSNFGQVNKEGRLSMEWEWGLTPKVVKFIQSQTKEGESNDI